MSLRRNIIELLTVFLFIQEFLTNILRFVGLGRRYYQKDYHLNGRTILITGANSGIGKETTYQLAKRGAKVLMCCRDVNKGQKALNDIRKDLPLAKLEVLQLDLSSLNSIRTFGKNLKNIVNKIDILINNAGVMMLPQRTKSLDNYELQFATNHLGHFLLTHFVLPLMVHSEDARIINVSSIHHIRGQIYFDDINFEKPGKYDPVEAYCQSKLANVLFTRHLAKQLNLNEKYSNICTYSLNPGTINTELTRHVTGLRKIIFTIIGKIFNLDVYSGCQTILFCAIEPTLRKSSGKYFSNCKENKCLFQESMDDQSAKRLWNISSKMVNIKPEDYFIAN